MDEKIIAKTQQLLVGEALRIAAHNVPDREAFVYEDERLSYKEILQRAEQLGGWLQSRGIKLDDKVGCLYKNGLPFVELYFATSLTGAVMVPVNFRLVSKEINYILNQSDVKILFIEEEFIEQIAPIIGELPQIETIVIVGDKTAEWEKETISYKQIFEKEIPLVEIDISDDDAHCIIFTSGTTGKPKGAVLTHKNIYMNGLNKMYHSQWPKGMNQLVVPPLFHVAALSTLVQNCLLEGTIFIHRNFEPKLILETIEKEKINAMFLVPAMWNFLFQVPNLEQYDLSSMKSCGVGGAICPLELKKRILEVFENATIVEAFGQTEMSPSACYLTGEDVFRKLESVGKPSINVRVRIVDDEMNDVPVGEVGEIIYQGPTVMKEYYKNPEATKEAFKGGWFHSGDLVKRDEEGYIYVVDRKKDMIISGGENIYPKEIEEVLYTHPSILEAAVIGVPDPQWGESVKACIVLKPGEKMTAEEVIAYCQENLASYKKPKIVEFMDALPRNAAGKVLKTVLRAQSEPKGVK